VDRLLFLSYAQEAMPVVEEFENELQAHLLRTWRDDQLAHGQPFSATFQAALRRTTVVLIFLCPSAVEALRDPTRGHKEARQVMAWRENPSRQRNERVVLVDLADYTDEQVAEMEVIWPLAHDYRLKLSAVQRNGFSETKHAIPGAVRRAVRELITRSLEGEVQLFPRLAATSAKHYYALSGTACHGRATVQSEWAPLAWEGGAPRPHIPLRSRRSQHTLRIAFSQTGMAPDDWWAAFVGFDRDLRAQWVAVNLSRFRRLMLEARAADGGPFPLHVRLEDDARTLGSGSHHRLTGWAKCAVLTEVFGTISLDLDRDFDWRTEAFPDNQGRPDRSRILQVTVGHDGWLTESGVIEIRRISVA